MSQKTATQPPSPTETQEAPLVKLKSIRGRHRVPARLIKVEGKKAYVVPKGHKHVIAVPLRAVSMWKSRTRNL